MANRIKELDGLSVGTGGGSPIESIRPASAVTPAGAGAGSSSNTDNVQITHNARLLTSLSQAVQNAPEMDMARVTRLQQAIDSGQYSIDPDQTAARLLRLEQDLAETQPQ
jgi:flagellar biosynthesis anti-sigma factor FlgM